MAPVQLVGPAGPPYVWPTLTAQITVPPDLVTPLTFLVTNTSPFYIGQVVGIGQNTSALAFPGPATFKITAITSNSLTGLWINSVGDVAPGTVISIGATVSPTSGIWTPTYYQAFAAPSTVIPGTNTYSASLASITLAQPGTYSIQGKIRFDFNGGTSTASQVITMDLFRSNNTPVELIISDGYTPYQAATAGFMSAGNLITEPLIYPTLVATDIIQVRAKLSGAIAAGTLVVGNVWIHAQRIA